MLSTLIHPSELLFAQRPQVAAGLLRFVGIEDLRFWSNERVTHGFIGGVRDTHGAQAAHASQSRQQQCPFLWLVQSMAHLVFQSKATGTRIVAADLCVKTAPLLENRRAWLWSKDAPLLRSIASPKISDQRPLTIDLPPLFCGKSAGIG